MNEEELKQRIIADLHFLKGYFMLRGKFPEEKIDEGFSLMANTLLSEFDIKFKRSE